MKHARDQRTRKEWGSNEFININESYIPTHSYTEKKITPMQSNLEKDDIYYSTSSSECDSNEDSSEQDYGLKSLENRNDKISKDSFEYICVIGSGSYGKVFLVREKETKEIYAMKVLKKSFLKRNNMVENTWSE